MAGLPPLPPRRGRTAGDPAAPRAPRRGVATGLNPRLAAERVEGEPWRPPELLEALAGTAPQAGSYVVVDELIDDAATLRVVPWPIVDAKGRLRFPRSHEGFDIGTVASRFAARADADRDVARPLRVGDVFWAVVARPARAADRDAVDLLEGPVFDISAVARTAAKAQYFSAVSPVLDEEDVMALYDDLLRGDED